MIINYDKVIEQDIPIYERAMANAVAFIKYKYPTICFCGLKVYLFSRKGRSTFSAWKKQGWRIKIHGRFKVHFYNRKSCGLTTPTGGIEVPLELAVTSTIIHELTHYAQALYSPVKIQKIKKGTVLKKWEFGTFTEIDTTKNEIEHLKMYHPEVYKKLIKTETDYPVPTYLENLLLKIKKGKIEMENKEQETVVIKAVAGLSKTEKVKPIVNRDEAKRNKLLFKLKEWETKKKRADNAIKKITKKVKYYDNKLKK